jgi:5'-3' exoribonuclease 1
MGVPAYFSYIIKNYPKIIRTIDNLNQVHNLYLDCNSIIYDAIYSIKENKPEMNKTIIKIVCDTLEEFLSRIKPSGHIFIAFDGVAPVAKLEQQRTRRIRSKLVSKITDTIDPDRFKLNFDTTCITPGTTFMDQLAKNVEHNFSNPEKYGAQKITVSCSDIHGEGEHKLFEYIRENIEYHENKNTVIYGLDADLIMLSINHLPICKNIYLFRETPEFIKSLDNTLDPNKLYMIDIPKLAERLSYELNQGKEVEESMKNNKIYDYIFLCFFLGNDFMPHFPSLNIRSSGIQILMETYASIFTDSNENLIVDQNIKWKNLRKLITSLAENEETNIIDEYTIRNKREKHYVRANTPEEKLEKLNNIPMLERYEERYINPTLPGWQDRYYERLFHMEITDERRKQICFNYIEALEWTMKYYTSGCVDWRWKYKYNYAPLLEDLVKYIPYFQTSMFKEQNNNVVSPHTQLSYVLPKSSLNLLPKHIETALLNKHPEWYNENINACWSFCKYFWESHMILPHIDLNELEKITTC